MGLPTPGPTIQKWSGPPIIDKFLSAVEAGQKREEQRRKIREGENAEHAERGADIVANIESEAKITGKAGLQSYAFPGHQGRLGQIGGELVYPTAQIEKPIAEHTEEEKMARVSDIAKQLGVPMQPGRQVTAWANRTHLPKAEGGQGTLFAPRKYR